MNFTVLAAAKTHHSKGFDELTTQGTSSNHKSFGVLKFALNFPAKNLNLVVIATVFHLAVHFTSGNGLEDIVMEPLLERRVFAGEFYNFLGEEATEESGLGANRAGRVDGSLHHNVFFNFFDEVELLSFPVSLNLFRQFNNGSGIASVRVAL
jgi:hypothetical protein